MSVRFSSLLSAVAVSIFFAAYVVEAKPKPSPKPDIKALLITGGCCHDYNTQREIIPATIDTHTDLIVQWTVVHQRTTAGDILLDFYKNPNWAEGYDIVVHNECFAHINDDEYIAQILKPHKNGIPAVLVHCSMHSYREGENPEAWWEFCGVHSPGHGSKHPFEVKLINVEHEITNGMSNWTTPQGELYFIEKIYPTATPLGESKAESSWNSEIHTTIWVNEYGPKKTRVFATSIGHHNETMVEANYMQMLTRGFLWAAGRAVADNLTISE